MVGSLRFAAVTAVVALALLSGGTQPASAQAASSPIAVVDVQGALRSSDAAKEIQTKINERRQAYQRQVSEEEKALRAAEQELQQQRSVLAPEVYQQRLRAFRDRVTGVQKSVQERRRALDQAFTTAMNKVRDVLVSVIAEIADERGAQVVLFKEQIVIAEKSLDFSDEALRRLNQRLPTVPVDLPPLD
ncbi:OmpH family outer membrane protein [Thalassobaculum sp. OXR-137]|uniref:OmpH family outer membrane protein n=1 Tax=Thalassobaculum sp. OXR-137 TaxID=3100173 RepID=UPI002AC9282F|nr:OmpH family outer membrane protein [Thalassobaculum sp. OXR-137]WPZ32850.1 OmpH family outer membrane protein [Thalassobaculum sp. OXR-137]